MTNRAKAKLQGLSSYDSDQPCSDGHIAKRRTGNGECMRCRYLRVLKMRRGVDRKLDMRTRAIEYLSSKCIDCGWKGHHAGFEFDHVSGRGERKEMKRHFARSTWTTIKRELDEGIELVCGTCHNIRTYTRQKESS